MVVAVLILVVAVLIWWSVPTSVGRTLHDGAVERTRLHRVKISAE